MFACFLGSFLNEHHHMQKLNTDKVGSLLILSFRKERIDWYLRLQTLSHIMGQFLITIFQNKVLFGNTCQPEMTSSNDALWHRKNLIEANKTRGKKFLTQVIIQGSITSSLNSNNILGTYEHISQDQFFKSPHYANWYLWFALKLYIESKSAVFQIIW